VKLARTVAAVTTLLCVGSGAVHADPLYLPTGSGVVITFDLPPQPVEHNGFMLFANFGMHATTVVETQLFDEGGLLAQASGDGVFLRFTDPSSSFSGLLYSVDIDFSRLADGATGARLVLTVGGTGPDAYISFDTSDLRGWGFGDTGTLAGYDAVVTNVMPFTATVPEPGLLWMLVGGLPLVFGASRTRALRS
jgi:hypothetical protein